MLKKIQSLLSYGTDLPGNSPWVWILLLAPTILLFILRFSFLSLGSYWDEIWVYHPAVHYLIEHGVSFDPNALPVDLSRGHPTLFHNLFALWGVIFGDSVITLRLFALLVSASSLVFLGLVLRHFKLPLILIFLVEISLIAQPEFFQQSTQILPEVMLGLFVLSSLYFYLKRNLILLALSLNLLLMTKESGIIFWFLFLVCEWLFYSREKRGQVIRTSLSILAGLAIPVLFFVVQYFEKGWVFFPEHTGMLNFEYHDILVNFQNFYLRVFEFKGRYLLSLSIWLSIGLVWPYSNWKIRIFHLVLLGSLLKVLFGYWEVPNEWVIPVCAVMIAGFVYTFFIPWKKQSDEKKMVTFGLMACVLFIGYSAINFFTFRYLLCLIPIFLGGSALLLHRSFAQWTIVPVLIFVGAISWNVVDWQEEKIFDVSSGYKDGVESFQEAMLKIEELDIYDKSIHVGFLDKYAFNHAYIGYRNSTIPFTAINTLPRGESEYVLCKNFGNECDPENLKDEYEVVFCVEKGIAYSCLLQRKSQN
ncbi:hypothetical protein KFE98_15385 [bacterium SCSIO 12741]|nr:hypothetical protein KFE98_15385 [bacterium SCSIO 12741]